MAQTCQECLVLSGLFMLQKKCMGLMVRHKKIIIGFVCHHYKEIQLYVDLKYTY